MSLFSEPTLASGTYLIEFSKPIPKMRFEQARAEAAFGELLKCQSEQTNLPDQFDPNAPRILFASPDGQRTLTISQVRCQLDLNFEGANESRQARLDKFRSVARRFHRRANSDFALDTFRLNACLLNLKYPSKADTSGELNDYIYKQFFARALPLKVASAQFAVGFEYKNFFANVGANVVEERRVVSFGSGTHVVNLQEMPVVSRGVNFSVDINNRPMLADPKYVCAPDANYLLDAASDFLANEFTQFSGMSW